ncbi:MAG: hypothetical protein ACRD3O_12665 [Terriglobia bacterium]
MDVEKTVQFILEMQAKHEAAVARHDVEIAELRALSRDTADRLRALAQDTAERLRALAQDTADQFRTVARILNTQNDRLALHRERMDAQDRRFDAFIERFDEFLRGQRPNGLGEK